MRKWACASLVLAAAVAAAAGCAGRQNLRRNVQPPPAAEPADPVPAAPAESGDAVNDRTFSDVLQQDLREVPAELWDGARTSFADPANLLALGLAFGADRVVRNNLDEDVRDHTAHHHTSLHETGDFGSVIGNPALHFGVAAAWYAAAVHRQDDVGHQRAKTLIEALAVNGLATTTLKLVAFDKSPNDAYFGWPSGHTSSSVCFASVIHEFYGWKAALPLYALAGYSAATRVEDREHDVSDLVFGTALGLVVGHSVAQGGLPEVAGFQAMPYIGPNASGIMLMKRW